MNDVTQLLNAVSSGQQVASDELLARVYDELRSMAAQKMFREKPGATLQATALVHEAYMRLVKPDDNEHHWNSRGHFFAAAAEAMRRILVESARARMRKKRGGDNQKEDFKLDGFAIPDPERVIEINDALSVLAEDSEEAARLVVLRYFAGFTNAEAAEAMGISPRKGNDLWAYARVWLASRLREAPPQ